MSKTITMKDRLTQFARTASRDEIRSMRDLLDFALLFKPGTDPAPEVKRGRPVGSRNKPPADTAEGAEK